MRKHLVEYDDVINKHREAIYRRRREILEIAESEGEHGDKTLGDIILEYVSSEIEKVVEFNCIGDLRDWKLKEIGETISNIFNLSTAEKDKIETISKSEVHDPGQEIVVYLTNLAKEKYGKLTDAFKQIEVEAKEIEKGILIRSIDQLWIEHLETMDYLRGSIGLRGYGQRDPLVEYKKESFRLYQELNDLIRQQVVYSIFKTGDAIDMAPEILLSLQREEKPKNLQFAGAIKEAGDNPHGEIFDLVNEKMKGEDGKAVGRNDLCPCGSGKKFKKCHGK